MAPPLPPEVDPEIGALVKVTLYVTPAKYMNPPLPVFALKFDRVGCTKFVPGISRIL